MNFIKKGAKIATQSIQTYTPANKGQRTKKKTDYHNLLRPQPINKISYRKRAIVYEQLSLSP